MYNAKYTTGMPHLKIRINELGFSKLRLHLSTCTQKLLRTTEMKIIRAIHAWEGA